MSDDKKVAGFKGTWNDEDGKFKFDTQYKGTPLKFLSDEDFMVVETDGNIKSIDVSTGVTGGNGPYSYSMYNQNGTPEGISIDSDTGVISGKLEKGEQGVMTIDVSALDDDGLSISKSIRIAYSLPGEPGKKNDDNGDGGDNTLLYVAIAAIAAVAIVAVVYVLLKKRKAKQ
jgi:hypothetical protein